MESGGTNKAGKETARHGDSISADLDQLKAGQCQQAGRCAYTGDQAQPLEARAGAVLLLLVCDINSGFSLRKWRGGDDNPQHNTLAIEL